MGTGERGGAGRGAACLAGEAGASVGARVPRVSSAARCRIADEWRVLCRRPGAAPHVPRARRRRHPRRVRSTRDSLAHPQYTRLASSGM